MDTLSKDDIEGAMIRQLQPFVAKIQSLPDGQCVILTDSQAVVVELKGVAQSIDRQQAVPQSLVNTQSQQIAEYQKQSQQQTAVLPHPQGELHMRQSPMNRNVNSTGQEINAQH